jgi:hypothetical protein
MDIVNQLIDSAVNCRNPQFINPSVHESVNESPRLDGVMLLESISCAPQRESDQIRESPRQFKSIAAHATG